MQYLQTTTKTRRSGFNLYHDIKNKLIDNGIPENQIVVMESGMTDKKKSEIFTKNELR